MVKSLHVINSFSVAYQFLFSTLFLAIPIFKAFIVRSLHYYKTMVVWFALVSPSKPSQPWPGK
jgi:hypothetical protein